MQDTDLHHPGDMNRYLATLTGQSEVQDETQTPNAHGTNIRSNLGVDTRCGCRGF